ncbi:MAG TPA: hypothetical protein VGL49_05970 [Acidimicrobiales bacterium]
MADPQRGDDLVAAFTAWAAEQRTAAAAAGRTRERSQRELAGAAATWSGILVDLAEQASAVIVAVAGLRRPGRIVGVGRDFCVLDAPTRAALISLPAISALSSDQTRPGADQPAGDRHPTIELTLVAALARLAEQRAPVTVVARDGQETTGDLIAAGDVLTVRAPRPARRLTYVPLDAVALCDLR